MKKYEILQIAAEEYQDAVVADSNFGVVRNLMKSAISIGKNEDQRKEGILNALTNVFRVKEDSIAGCKSQDIQKVVTSSFGIRGEDRKSAKKRVFEMPSEELYLYFCYIEHLAKSPKKTKELILQEIKRTANVKKEIQEKIRREKSLQEEKERQEKLDKMTWEERIAYDMEQTKDKDMEYYRQLSSCTEEEKRPLAEALRQHWKRTGKWTGSKVSKKQVEKVRYLKEILGEHT